ncbi:MAG: tetratricopeptide repeat protein [Bacteroidales bacterium]|nr:tetratricopeptide repeat protein [Bacteroidales bacterium]MDD4217522.1 tetratricopeptide repeat protein [Bacteroidales bacterium]MDY0142444.1 tetratricopeptide repeat protein [Bacteroidales bacterium]
MKKVSVLLVLACLSIVVFAQPNKVTSAWSYLKDGFLEDAKQAIDQAETHPKTSNWYKTYYFKGQIYQELGVSERPKYRALCDDCFEISYEAYMKALRLNFVKEEHRNIDFESEVGMMQFVKILQVNDQRDFEDFEAFADILMNRFPALSNAFINQGVSAYQGDEYEKAYSNFEKAVQISTLAFKVDTQLFYFASLAALKAEKYEDAIQLNEVLMSLNFGETPDDKVGLYLNQATAYKITGDTVKMLKTLQTGIEKYPDNNYVLVIETFNYYVNTGENAKAFEYITMAIDKNPNDAQFYVIKGTLLEELGRKQEAKTEYEKALELKPENFDANYSLGAFYYNAAVDTLDWADKNIPITEFAKLDKFKIISNEYFEQSLPYLEKAYAQQPKNVNVLGTLRVIYYRLQKMEDYQRIKDELDALTE